MNRVRYMLKRDANFIIDKNNNKIPVSHKDTIFVDILSPMESEGICSPVNIKAFLNNGDIVEGTVSGHLIGLYNKDALFDGRFNSDK